MIDDISVVDALGGTMLEPWGNPIRDQILARTSRPHGDLNKWIDAIESLPSGKCSGIDLGVDAVKIGSRDDLLENDITAPLRQLMPWRKGPFELFGTLLDTEWRSDWKWQRLLPHIVSLENRLVLDIGCGSGYHCWRARGAGARLVVGIDPLHLFVAQFQAIRRLMTPCSEPVYVLPLGIDDLPGDMTGFDTVFSMGVMYHRKSPIDHLLRLKELLRPGGQVVLETLVVEGDPSTVLVPEGRYARMRNVWMIPSADALKLWMLRAGFSTVTIVDITATTVEEQRSTDWMAFESLTEALCPEDASKTVEGYPAPTRAILVAES